MQVVYLKEAGEVRQFLGQIRGIRLQLRKIVMRMEDGLNLGGQNHTHKGIIFPHQGLFEAVRMILRPIG